MLLSAFLKCTIPIHREGCAVCASWRAPWDQKEADEDDPETDCNPMQPYLSHLKYTLLEQIMEVKNHRNMVIQWAMSHFHDCFRESRLDVVCYSQI